MPPDRVLVTGGTGVVGRPLVERLVAHGRSVLALARSERAATSLREMGAIPVPGDVLDPPSLGAAMGGVATVFHAAGANAVCLRDPTRLFRTNVEGSANVIRAAADRNVGRVVYTSSAATIGEARGTIGREDAPHRGWYLSDYERSKAVAERRVFELAGELGVEVIAVNPSSVQGPGRTSGSARLLLEAVNGRLPALVDTTISIVDVDDCTRGHVLAESHGAAGERYVLSGASVTTRQAVEILRRLCGRPEGVRWIPSWVATAAGALVEVGARILRRDPPVCREAVRTLLHGHRYDGSRATRELGVRYTPLEETLRRTLAWYADRGLAPPPRAAAT
ncbi:MAG TPA: SDR family NAD(P)-dependent oxidoreductase [Actinomycetota bacterium]|nr:SDR family NAD(P)-dependent oxidoreductase [Actinomycetota bacterium]